MKKLFSTRVVALVIALLLISQLCICDFTTFAQNSEINNPPTAYPENCYKKLGVEIDVSGDFTGSKCTATKATYPITNLSKYLTFEFDVYVVSSANASTLRTYFLDSTDWVYTGNGSKKGRGFADSTVKTNEWQHVVITSWNTGYGMNGDVTDSHGMMIEAFNNTDTRLVVKNVCVTADDIVSPDGYPERLITKVKGSAIDHLYQITDTEKEMTCNFDLIDISYGDFVEIDYYIGTSITIDSEISIVFKDKNSKRATYKFNRVPNEWQHIKFRLGELNMDDGFDVTKVCAYTVVGVSVTDRIYFDNLCITGIAWPLEYPDGTVEKLGSKFDITGTTGGKTTVTSYGRSYDFSAHDFLEFDIYIESSESTEKVYFFLYDSSYNGTSNTPSSAQRKQYNYTDIETNKWVHIRTIISDFSKGNGNGDLTDICGFFVTALSKANRYIIVNQCLSNMQIPEAANRYTFVADFDKDIDYKGKNAVSDKVELETEVDLTAGTYIEFDSSVVTTKDLVNAKLVLEDVNGKRISKNVDFTANAWKHCALKLSDFSGDSDIGAIKTIYVEDIEDSGRICVYNLSLTKIEVPENTHEYTIEEKIFDSWIWKGKSGERHYFNEARTPIDLTAREFIELDLLVETDVDNPTFRMFFIDESGKKGFHDFSLKSGVNIGNGWYHFVFKARDFNTGYGFNGDRTKAICFSLTDAVSGAVYHLNNACFTYFEKPALETRYDVILDTGISGSFSKINGAAAFATRTFINEDKSTVDLTQGTHIEVDVYISSQKENANIRIFYLDERFNNATLGRGLWAKTLETNKWHHLILDLDMADTSYGMNGDKTKVDSFMFAAGTDGDEIYTIHNLVLTKRQTAEQQIGVLPATPDKDSTYISDCETLMNDMGIWNTPGISATNFYKTEGNASVRYKVSTLSDNSNSLRFLFNNPCDFTAAESIRFDMFIDDTLIAKMNKFKVTLTSDKRFNKNSYEYMLDSQNLVMGWNSFEIPIKDFVAQDGADLSSIRGFALGLVNTYLGADEILYMGIDNLRVYKTFTVLAPEEEEIFEDFEEDIPVDDLFADNETDFEYNEPDLQETIQQEDVENLTQQDGQDGYVKKIVKRRKVNSGMSTDRIVVITVISIAGVLLITAIVLSVLTECKYRRVLKNRKIG